ncbi:MAG TPA: hypothetical protein VGU02_11150, partial [Gaiellaceae bacterium]|nr:hypothetical protein [Gaiellaceae bacterium]
MSPGARSRTVVAVAGCAACFVVGAAAFAHRAAHGQAGETQIVAVVGRTPVTAQEIDTGRKSVPGASAAQMRAQLIREAVLVDVARQLHLLGSLTLEGLAADPAQVAVLNERLYDHAARKIGVDRLALAGGKGDEGPGVPADESSDAVGRRFDAWFAERDRVASAWFGALYARYRHLTHL